MDCIEVPMPITFSELGNFPQGRMTIKCLFDYTNDLMYDINQITTWGEDMSEKERDSCDFYYEPRVREVRSALTPGKMAGWKVKDA